MLTTTFKKSLFKPIAECYKAIMNSIEVQKRQENKGVIRRNYDALQSYLRLMFQVLDRRFDGNISFFFRHWGKSKFMISMSKRVQMHGVENVFLKSRKAFFYFFMFYLIRDTILYIIIPIYFAKSTGN